MKSFTVELDDDTYFFLEFLERTRSIKNKDEAVRKALIMFKDLSMHDWLPHARARTQEALWATIFVNSIRRQKGVNQLSSHTSSTDPTLRL
jgi:hypothetical protein